MPRTDAELRSLERRSLYQAFAPLDAEERLPRELLIEGRRSRSWGRRELAGLIWLPSLLASLTAVRWAGGGAPVAVAASISLLGGLVLFARSGRAAEQP